jgi:hypothetical protein
MTYRSIDARTNIARSTRITPTATHNFRRRPAMRTQAEPPAEPPSTPDLFLIGRNSRGAWVVRDQRGLRGGLFIDRVEALRFALFENGRRPQAVVMVPEGLELDLGPSAKAASQPRADFKALPERKAA